MFPILKQKINNKKIIYFDNAATTQKPREVIEAVANFYNTSNSNVHRSINPLAHKATKQYESVRKNVQLFISAKNKQEIIFTRGTTEGINLIANTWGKNNLAKDDIVVLTQVEHHANIVPWMILQFQIGFKIQYIKLDGDYRLDLENAVKLLKNKKVKLLSIQHASNVTGTVNDIKALIKIAKKNKITTLIDAAQSIAHEKVDVSKLDCDFLVFSSHKIYGPTGVGVLYGKKELLEQMPVWQGGGDMISEVSLDGFKQAQLPYKFEAGTPNIAGVIGLGAAIDYINKIGFSKIKKTEKELTKYFLEKIKKYKYIDLIGSKKITNRLPVFSLSVKGVHPHDLADLLGSQAIITRAGNHCVEPFHSECGLVATLRASLAIYNTKKEIDVFFRNLAKIYKKFQ